MALSWQISDHEFDTGSDTTRVVDRPAGATEGETLVAFWMFREGLRVPVHLFAAAGFVLKYVEGDRGIDQQRPKCAVFTKKVTASEPSSYTFSTTGATGINLLIIGRVTGAGGANIGDVEISFASILNSSGQTAQSVPAQSEGFPSADYLRLWVGLGRYSSSVVDGFTVTEPESFEEVFSHNQAPGNGGFNVAIWAEDMAGDSASQVDSTSGSFSNSLAFYLLMREMSEETSQGAVAFPESNPTLANFTPTGAGDPESSNPEDLGDFTEPRTPEYESQKNMSRVGFDPRTGVIMMVQGGWGSFGENPATSQKVNISRDCGKTFIQVADLEDVVRPHWWDLGTNWAQYFDTIQAILPGEEPGHWLIFDAACDYWVSLDDGSTWSARQRAGIGMQAFSEWEENTDAYWGLVGISGGIDTRAISAAVYDGVYGFVYTIEDWDFRIWHGIRRSLGVNGAGGWEDSIPSAALGDGGTGWSFGGPFGDGSEFYPTIHGANGRWIVITPISNTRPFGEDPTPGNIRICNSPTLDPAEWGAPFFPVAVGYVDDVYQGSAPWLTGTTGDFRLVQRKFAATQGTATQRLKFIPISGHPAGGRWWFMGIPNVLLVSDDNGDTWSNRLSDHRRPIDEMHPILNWRRLNPLGYRASHAHVLDIVGDPFGQGRLMSIGITYDRTGIVNRLAVFSVSSDGGDTWGPVGQLPLRLSNIQGSGTTAGADSPSVARHIFPCVHGGVGTEGPDPAPPLDPGDVFVAEDLPDPTHFASPTGGGDGSEGSPFLIEDYWAVRQPGDVLGLVDGVYTGPGSRITPPAGLSGTIEDPLVIRALNDGGVRFNGEGNICVDLGEDNIYWWLEGFNAHNGGSAVIRIRGESNLNLVRRVIAWDASATLNSSVFDISGSSQNTVEDCGGFGIGRRIFQSSQFQRQITWRRCWGMWQRWNGDGVKKGVQIGYQGHEDSCENVVMTWDRSGGSSVSERGALTFGRVDKPDPPNTNSQSKMLGCIAYILAGQEVGSLAQLVDVMTGTGGNLIQDLLLYTAQTNNPNRMVALREQSPGSIYRDVTEIGDVGSSSIHSSWAVTNRVTAASVGAAPSPWDAPGAGARVRNRYVDGVLTETPLWPWPMDARLRAALTTSGRNPDTVFGGSGNGLTDLMEDIFGPVNP